VDEAGGDQLIDGGGDPLEGSHRVAFQIERDQRGGDQHHPVEPAAGTPTAAT
jgi:hypothetical protein